MTVDDGREQATGDAPATPSVTRRHAADADVFISYASADKHLADSICAALERGGIVCWIAPRNVTPGVFYANAIVEAINSARILIVILSTNSVGSQHVLREVERASAKRRPLVAFRLDTTPLPTGLEYFLSASHWLDASGGSTERALTDLLDAVHRLLEATDEPAVDSSIRNETTVNASSGVAAARGSAQTPRWNRLWTTVAVMAVVLVALLAGKYWPSKHVAADRQTAVATNVVSGESIAVLSFTDLSEKKDQEYFADGMAEEIIDLLTKIPSLRVIGRTSSFQFKGRNIDLREVGSLLGAAYVLEGSVRRSQDRIRVTAQLIDSRDGTHRWSESYDRPIGDAIKVQDDIAAGLVRAIQVAVGAADPVVRETAIDPAAYDLYLRARAARDRSDTQGTRESIRYYEQALKIAPTFAEAALALASDFTDYVASGEGGLDTDARSASEEVAARARAAIEAASQLNHSAPSLYGMRSKIYARQDLNFRAAEAEMDSGIQIAPDDSETQYYASALECTLGRWEAGLEHKRVALERDPLNAGMHASYASCLLRAGRPEEAEEQARRALTISPTEEISRVYLGHAALMRGELAVALDAFNNVPSPFTDAKLAGLAAVYHAMSRAKDSDLAMRQLETDRALTDPYLIAQAHANREEFDAALQWLNRAADAKDGWIPAFAKGDPAFTRYRSDPRYRAWLRKLNLPE